MWFLILAVSFSLQQIPIKFDKLDECLSYRQVMIEAYPDKGLEEILLCVRDA